MFWNIASLVGTVVTILCATFSFIAWIKTKKYYHKIVLIEDIEKVDDALSDIKNSKDTYNAILSLFGNIRGVSVETIKKKFRNIKDYIQNIENELPQRYVEIHSLCREPIDYIDKIIGGQIECKNCQDFKLLQLNINLIHKNLKMKRDELRGIK